MNKQVDSYRYLDFITRQMVKAWIGLEKPTAIPWTPLTKPLADCTVALISTAGIALKTDQPFNQQGERDNPWWGDPSYRLLPRTTTAQDVGIYHQHIDPRFGLQDLNCMLPLQRLLELESAGEIGASAPHHYSFMGYILQPEVLLIESVPAMIRQMRDERVDVVLLAPV
jgi:D-proline reductase (dithiol) PrdB